jgi:hypothetical protein
MLPGVRRAAPATMRLPRCGGHDAAAAHPRVRREAWFLLRSFIMRQLLSARAPNVSRSLPWFLVVSGVVLALTMSNQVGPGVSADEVPEGHEVVRFTALSGFEWMPEGLDEVVASRGMATIPRTVQRLDGRRVFIKGFMLPMEGDAHGVTLFMLNANVDMCYFGAPVRPNDWILVRMKPGAAAEYTHRPTAVWGRLEVGASIEAGRVTSLYRLVDAEARVDEG